MHLVHTNRAPRYLSDCVQTVLRASGRPGLRSSDTVAYVRLRCRTRLGERGFCYAVKVICFKIKVSYLNFILLRYVTLYNFIKLIFWVVDCLILYFDPSFINRRFASEYFYL